MSIHSRIIRHYCPVFKTFVGRKSFAGRKLVGLGPRINPKGCPTPPCFTLQQSIPNHTPPPTAPHISDLHPHTNQYVPPTHRTSPIPIPGGD